ncbi:MAG: sulfotransferase family 2 domain-containing protein [Hyphomicrobiales bacterium]|nr:sulfotransferase family 2 domain-containing protein [Hyphomicrobiales bacterium]
MFGFGGYVKGTARRSLTAMADRQLAARHPEAVAFYRNLEADCMSPTHSFHVFERLKAIYYEVPKAGSSTVLATLAEADSGLSLADEHVAHDRKRSGIKGPRELGLEHFYAMATSPDVLKLTFVRNPYRRLVSCWVDKFSAQPVRLDRRSRDVLRRGGLVPEQLDQTRPLPLADFVTLACNTAKAGINGHWQLMSTMVPQGAAAPDVIGRVETLDADLGAILQRLRAADRAKVRVHNVKQPGGARASLSQQQADMIFAAYREDFERFGYLRALAAS